jgi:hypothetical protein
VAVVLALRSRVLAAVAVRPLDTLAASRLRPVTVVLVRVFSPPVVTRRERVLSAVLSLVKRLRVNVPSSPLAVEVTVRLRSSPLLLVTPVRLRVSDGSASTRLSGVRSS